MIWIYRTLSSRRCIDVCPLRNGIRHFILGWIFSSHNSYINVYNMYTFFPRRINCRRSATVTVWRCNRMVGSISAGRGCCAYGRYVTGNRKRCIKKTNSLNNSKHRPTNNPFPLLLHRFWFCFKSTIIIYNNTRVYST